MNYCYIFLFFVWSTGIGFAQHPFSLLQEADTLFEYGAYVQSLAKYQNASMSYQGSDKSSYLYCKNKSAECLVRIGRLDEAASIIQQELNENSGNNPIDRATLHHTQATILMYKGRIDQALQEARLALSYIEINSTYSSPSTSYTTSEVYNTIGLCYWLQGNLESAEEYLYQALRIRQQLPKPKPASIAAIQNNLGLIYTGNQNNKALLSFQSALTEYQKIYPNTHESIAITISNIALIYRLDGIYNTSLIEYDKAWAIWNTLYPKDHSNKAFIYTSKAQVYVEQKNYTAALEDCQKAIDMYQRIYTAPQTQTANAYLLKGEIHKAMKQYGAALEQFQFALQHNSYSFRPTSIYQNPSLEQSIDPTLLLTCLLEKAHCLSLVHEEKTLRMKDLQASLNTYYAADTILTEIRKIRKGKKDKINASRWASELNERAVDVAYKLSQNSTRPQQYLKDCFYFMEKNKSAVLQQAISDAQAKSFGGIPDSLLAKEEEYQIQLTWLEQQLLKTTDTLNDITSIKASYFSLKREYENFIQALEKQYPDYFQLKYASAIPSVESIQQKLKIDEAMVVYLSSESSQTLYRLCITTKEIRMSTALTPERLTKTVTAFLNSVQYQLTNTFVKTNEILSAYYLPVLPKSIRHIIIVADGIATTIPFELLFTSRPKSDTAAWTAYPYVIKKYAVSYAFAAGLYESYSYQGKGKGLLAFAPIDFPGLQINSLPGSAEEVNALGKLYAGSQVTIRKNEAASKAYLRSDSISNYSILHLATHGWVHPSEPELSSIYFYGKDPESSTLYSGDIYTLNFKQVQLICLSACETGKGKLTKGEGLIGLSRALLYAGADNIVVSYWKVSDEATARLMTYFHQYITDGEKEYYEALRLAKLKLIEEGEYAAPYYWAAFVLIGE
ncbi:MAG: CHAT domain-containing protein [Cytophagaceae bacterium]|jgi:CHAT domain-containing protein/Tfp pilus assembly protein PilF|nr:CHAT domain-containing protein [Cytophagaceae bacterium]